MTTRHIEPNRLYSTQELRGILGGSLKLDTLRAHGLVGFASGYWGENIIYAINRYWRKLLHERGALSTQEVGDAAILENQIDHRSSESGSDPKRLEGPRQRSSLQPEGTLAGEVESLLSEYDQITSQKAVLGRVSGRRD